MAPAADPLPCDRASETVPREASQAIVNRTCLFGAAYRAVLPLYDQSPEVRGASIQFAGAGVGCVGREGVVGGVAGLGLGVG